ncbi:MAG: signal peptidase I [Chloroflexi bacterium]|nr:signal peptidase I [Chloroflexota bacterium]
MMRISIARLATQIIRSQLYTVKGDSMSPSFEHGERILVSRAAYDSATPVRGDVVIACAPRTSSLRYLKRIVGLPLEEVRLFDGTLYIDGAHLPEPYLGGLPAYVGLDDRTWKLGERDYFVLGDNRAHSTDSRDFGSIDANLILGKAWFRIWPLQRWGRINVT